MRSCLWSVTARPRGSLVTGLGWCYNLFTRKTERTCDPGTPAHHQCGANSQSELERKEVNQWEAAKFASPASLMYALFLTSYPARQSVSDPSSRIFESDNRTGGPLIILILYILSRILFKELPTLPDLDCLADVARVGAVLLHPADHLHPPDPSSENNMFSIEPLKKRCGV